MSELSPAQPTIPDHLRAIVNEVEETLKDVAIKPLSSFFVGTVAAMSGVLFGFDASIAAAVGGSVNTFFGLESAPLLQGLWVAAVPLGALIGALFGGKVSDRFGRKKGLIFNAFLFIAGIALAAVSPGFWVFVVARLMMGLAIGNSAVITPMYMAEVAPPESRGRILFMYQLSIVVGILFSFLVGVAVDASIKDTALNWRVMLAIGLIPAFIFLFGMFKMPQSPRWLIENQFLREAHHVLMRMMGREEARSTFCDIHEAAARKTSVNLKACFGKLILPVMLLGFFLQFFQQSTGINADMYFGPQIFSQGGFSASAAMWAQVAMGLVNLIATVVSIFLVDKLGRRKLMFIGVSGIIIMLGAQSYLFHRYEKFQQTAPAESRAVTTTDNAGQRPVLPNAGSAVTHEQTTDHREIALAIASSRNVSQAMHAAVEGKSVSVPADAQASAPTSPAGVTTPALPATPGKPPAITYWIFASILLYIVFFAISAGPLCWLMISEIFPIRFRGIGMSIAVAANWLVDYFVSQLFPVMKDGLGMSFTFLIYAAFTAVGLALAIRFLPETRGVPLEKIEENIYAGKPLRRIGL
ncbi:sugar porter family MFS transporter [Ruficoccus amylovorans]|uniref:Sugar porter family MFS transporter n=1 Tax=Ruficoccus amylovorans TaxID=1804625 RepID=A0A842HLW2_9BACT|nr:sugar porter family MFS transporter [Ruficoccus amylovorans]MBC2596447.1 sugar porter family MFS transporter [Ruficoccus amylovorans]